MIFENYTKNIFKEHNNNYTISVDGFLLKTMLIYSKMIRGQGHSNLENAIKVIKSLIFTWK